MVVAVKKELLKYANPEKARLLAGFFKTGKGEYGEGDIFIGVMVPQTRAVAKKFFDLSLKEVKELMSSKIHEHRLCAILILVDKFNRGDEKVKKNVYNFYMKNSEGVNNWDLVDLSAHKIVGAYLFDKDKKVLYDYAKSKNLWQRRISIISCFYFIDKHDFKDALKISELLLFDEHDLIHKAVGWMLREIGKKDQEVEEKFLKKYYKRMPRTMLRYAIEKFDEKKRKFYMKKD